METSYNPHDIEQSWYAQWEADNAFKPSGEGNPYSIVIPPPNVTGSLHMGHAFQHTIMDALTRYHRMKGDKTLMLPGTDHAAIATQNVVEKMLRKEGTSRHKLGREKFLEEVISSIDVIYLTFISHCMSKLLWCPIFPSNLYT